MSCTDCGIPAMLEVHNLAYSLVTPSATNRKLLL